MPIDGIRAANQAIPYERIEDPDVRDAFRAVEMGFDALVDRLSSARVYGAGDNHIAEVDSVRNNSTVLTPDAVLSTHIQVNAVYAVEAFIIWFSPFAAGIKLGFSAPTGSTFVWTWDLDNTIATPLALASTVDIPGQDADRIMCVRGTLTTGTTDGDFALNWAQLAAVVTDTKVKAGSWLSVTRLD